MCVVTAILNCFCVSVVIVIENYGTVVNMVVVIVYDSVVEMNQKSLLLQ